MKKLIKNFFSGIGMGIANVIPGLSGGTILVLTGAFEPLTEAVASVLKPHNEKRKSHLLLILEIVLGLMIGLTAFTFLIPWLSKFIYAQLVIFFLGIVLASSLLYYKKEIKNFKNIHWICFICGFLVCLAMVIFIHSTESINPTFSKHPSVGLLFALLGLGILAGAAMIFPGISGSLLLFLFGMYYKVWGYIKETIRQLLHFQFLWYMIVPCFLIGIGILIGIIASSWLSKWVLKKFRFPTLSLILGLILGGAMALIPVGNNLPTGITLTWNIWTILSTIMAFILGVLVIFLIQFFIAKKKANEREKNN